MPGPGRFQQPTNPRLRGCPEYHVARSSRPGQPSDRPAGIAGDDDLAVRLDVAADECVDRGRHYGPLFLPLAASR